MPSEDFALPREPLSVLRHSSVIKENSRGKLGIVYLAPIYARIRLKKTCSIGLYSALLSLRVDNCSCCQVELLL